MIRDQNYYFEVALPRAREFFGERGWGGLNPACLSSLQRAADAAKAASSTSVTLICIIKLCGDIALTLARTTYRMLPLAEKALI
jgi:hypothetical protein